MCTQIFTPTKILYTVKDMIDAGLILHASDFDNIEDFAEALTSNDCLCGVDVESILDNNDITYEWDPFGLKVTKGLD